MLYFCNNKKANSNNKGNGNKEKEATVVVDKITSVNKISINDTNQIANVDGKEFKLKNEISVDGSFLLIDDKIQSLDNGETIYADNAYVTNKFIIFTVIAQDNESMVYVINKDGKPISFESNNYQIHNLKVVNDHLQASGHIFCGEDGDCPDVDLDIIYDSNKIVVSPKQ
jgi:hypothetical protein